MPSEMLVMRGGVQMHGYLVEARSIGGLSGSPVFVSIEPWRTILEARARSSVATGAFQQNGLQPVRHGRFRKTENRPLGIEGRGILARRPPAEPLWPAAWQRPQARKDVDGQSNPKTRAIFAKPLTAHQE
jgi:hypothetical protein